MFKNVYDALGRGEMIGIAPEGVSRFLPFMAEPLKTGPARMALAAVELHMEKDENYQIKIVNSTDKDKREIYSKKLYSKLQRKGLLERDVDRLIRNDRIICCLLYTSPSPRD